MANSPHDALFRYTFGQPEHAAALLQAVLPPALAAELDWSTLSLSPGTRIDRRLRRHQTDLLYSVRAKKSVVHIHVIVEHSSRVDRWMAFRMLDYAMGIWREQIRRPRAPKRLRRIIPVVIHHGRHGWSAATDFADLIGPAPGSTPGRTSGDEPWHQPRFRYVVQSFSGMAPVELQALALTLLGKLTVAAMQYLPGAGLPRVVATIASWSDMMRRVLAAPSGEEAMAALSEYVLTTTRVDPEALIEVVEKEVNRRAGRIMQTAASKLRREGHAEGHAEGRAEGFAKGQLAGRIDLLVRQLTERFGPLSDEVSTRIAEGSEASVDRWARRVLHAASLDDVFDGQ